MTTKGHVWRSSVEKAVKAALNLPWDASGVSRQRFAIRPAGYNMVTEPFSPPFSHAPGFMLSVADLKKHRQDPDSVFELVNKACIGLMREGWEVLEHPAKRQGPVGEPRALSMDEMMKAFGPKKNGGPEGEN